MVKRTVKATAANTLTVRPAASPAMHPHQVSHLTASHTMERGLRAHMVSHRMAHHHHREEVTASSHRMEDTSILRVVAILDSIRAEMCVETQSLAGKP